MTEELNQKKREQMLEGQYKSSKDAAVYESVSSQLPGRLNGPADAYRHIIWIAETARRNKRRLGSLGGKLYAEGKGVIKELENEYLDNAPKEEIEMDLHNNNVALKIGMQAKNYEEVVQKAREKIEKSNGLGKNDDAVWLPEDKWDKNPKRKKTDKDGNLITDEQGNVVLEDVPKEDLNWINFDWDKKTNYEETKTDQNKVGNAVRKGSLKAGEKVEEFLENLSSKKTETQKPEQRGSLLSGEKGNMLVAERTPPSKEEIDRKKRQGLFVFVDETPRDVFGSLGGAPVTNPVIRLLKPLRSNAPATPEDVIKIRTGLEALGQVKRPDYGIVPYVDQRLFEGIKQFQKDNNLKVDGVINPLGETENKLNEHLSEVF